MLRVCLLQERKQKIFFFGGNARPAFDCDMVIHTPVRSLSCSSTSTPFSSPQTETRAREGYTHTYKEREGETARRQQEMKSPIVTLRTLRRHLPHPLSSLSRSAPKERATQHKRYATHLVRIHMPLADCFELRGEQRKRTRCDFTRAEIVESSHTFCSSLSQFPVTPTPPFFFTADSPSVGFDGSRCAVLALTSAVCLL
jgi:hypothetical protein